MTKGENINVTIYDVTKDKNIIYTIDDCIVQILAFEIQENFHIEVLRTFAIMIRTYIMRKMRLFDGKGCKKHPKADICNEPYHCIGLLPLEEIQEDKRKQLTQAVEDTENKIITFQGKIIFPYYHDTCGGSTENSERVLGNTIQYARRVLCDHCKSTSPHWQSSVEFTLEELEEKLNVRFSKPSSIEGPDMDKILYMAERDKEGRIIQIKIGDKLIKGKDFQRKLGLYSTRFGWQPTGIKFFVQGKGDGIGLCQYGAQGLALEGKNAEEIIKYYFTGVKIENIPQWSINIPLEGKIILIDAGHGGKELGIKKNNIIEKDMNLKISLELGDLLKKAGAKAILTRDSDIYLSLEDRLHLSNQLQPHFMLSIHGNDSPTMSNVTQIYVYPGDIEARDLGEFIIKELKYSGIKCKDVIETELCLTRESKKSTLVLDIGYFNLENNNAINKIATAIYKGLLNYWGIED
jgi:SpoIID/LytB domain protein